ncbi:MAG: ABC transporter substrate-binding protein, partial [Ilumatobacteraceae bacterium]
MLVSLALVAAACGSDSKGSTASTGASSGTTAEAPGTGETAPAGATVPGAATSAPAASNDERSKTLTLTLPQEPESWNYWEVGANALRVPTFYNVQETLLENLPDGTIKPMLAEAYKVSDDGMTVTFTIREAKFHDGTDLDSADVVYSMNKNAESPLGKLSTAYLNVAKVEAVDPRTVKVTLKNPSASFL